MFPSYRVAKLVKDLKHTKQKQWKAAKPSIVFILT